MANRKKESGYENHLTKIAFTTAIITLLNNLITLLIKLIELIK